MSALNPYQRRAYRWFGGIAQRRAQENPRLLVSLQQAHIHMRPEVFLSAAYLTTALVFALGIVLALVLAMASTAGLVDLPGSIFLYIIPLPGILAAIVYFVTLVLPDLNASNRARDIDAKLPYAINFIATMASAGASPERIFKSLSGQPIYGEVSNEAAWIHRDMEMLGMDVITALNGAIDRTPSERFQDFIQGAITTLSTGGDLKTYFVNKSEQYLLDNRQVQKQFLESLGVLAESFVVVVVAAPLFLLVILSVMASFGGDPERLLGVGYVMVLAMLPLAQFGFALTVKISTPEA